MSNIAQFVGQINNSSGIELINNGFIDMTGSRINRYIAMGDITSSTIDASKASLNSYLCIESVNSIKPITPNGVRLNFPSGIPQLLLDNNIQQGIWTQYLTSGISPDSELRRVTYGRATQLPGDVSTTYFVYKASLAVTSNIVAIVFATKNGAVDGFRIWLYNTDTKVLGASLFLSDKDLHTSFSESMGRRISSIVNLFSVNAGVILFALGFSGQESTLGTSDAFGAGAISLLINTTTMTITRGPVDTQVTGFGMNQLTDRKALGACWAQVSPTNYLFMYSTGAETSLCRGVVVNGTTGVITYSASTAISGSVGDYIAIPSINSVFILALLNSASAVRGALVSISGSSNPSIVYNTTLLSANSGFAYDSGSILQINTNTFMCVGGGGSNNNTWTFRSVTLSSGTINAGTEYKFAAKVAGGGLAKDFASFHRTDVYKNRFGERGPGIQYIPSLKTMLIPRDGSVTTIATTTANNTSVMALAIDGTVITVPGDNLIPNVPGQVLGVGQYMLFPDRSSAGTTQILVSDSAGAYSQGRKLILDGFNTTVEVTNFINDTTPLSLSFYWNREAFIVNPNFAFGRIRAGSDMKLYPLEKANRFTTNPNTNPEVALVLNGSTMLTSDNIAVNPTNVSYILDGCL